MAVETRTRIKARSTQAEVTPPANAKAEQAHPIPDPPGPENYYSADRPLQRALARYYQDDAEGWRRAEAYLRGWGAVCARQIAPLYDVAERNGPVLRQFDRRGERVDELVFHPTYHDIGRLVYGAGLAAMCNRPGVQGREGLARQLEKFAAMYLFTQAEGSIACPVAMTDILARVLNKYASNELIERYVSRLTSLDYDGLYTGAMFMTEKTGGSDVGATTTRARHTEEGWMLYGDKWFCSNAGADLVLTLARPEGAPEGTRGLGLFLLPRLLPDGRRNSYVINRLKDKLGTRAMASGEITLQGATAYLIEPLERGFVMMMEMVNGTRLHSGVAGAAALRRATMEATLHARERRAFGQILAQQPLAAEQLADLITDSAATTALALAAAHALDRADRPDAVCDDVLLSRLLISLLKRYATAHGVDGARIALELRGGNGYIEDWPNARLLRDAYVQIIWEGGLTMVAFDVLRTLERDGAWRVYATALQCELVGLTAPEIAPLATELGTALEGLGGACSLIMRGVRAAQEIAAPALAEAMAALYAAVLLAADANEAYRYKDGNAARALRTAVRYYRRAYQPAVALLPWCEGPAPEVADLIAGAL